MDVELVINSFWFLTIITAALYIKKDIFIIIYWIVFYIILIAKLVIEALFSKFVLYYQ